MAGELERIEKNFEIFSRGIERLQELEKELDSLDKNGFETEINEIKAKLKDVTEIPDIESGIKELKAKIENNSREGKKQTTLKEFNTFLNGIANKLETKLHQKIEDKHKEFHNKFQNFYKQKISENNTALAQVDFLKKQIKEMQQDIQTIKEQLKIQPNGKKLLFKIKKELDRVEEENQEIGIKQDIYYETLQEIVDRIKKLLEAKQTQNSGGNGKPAEDAEKKAEEKKAAEGIEEKQPEDADIGTLFEELESGKLE